MVSAPLVYVGYSAAAKSPMGWVLPVWGKKGGCEGQQGRVAPQIVVMAQQKEIGCVHDRELSVL